MMRSTIPRPGFLVLGSIAAVAAAAGSGADGQVDLLGGNRAARAEARRAITEAGPQAVPALLRRIEDPLFSVRWEVVNLLGWIGDPSAVEPLVERVLGDPNPHVRWRSLWALRAIGEPSVPDRFAASLGEADSIRWNAAVGLSMFGDARSLPLLTARIADDDPWIRWEAVNALGRVHDGRTSARLVELLDHPHLRTRQEAVMSLGRIGDPSAVRGLIRALGDSAPEIRWRAAMVLGKVREPEARTALGDRLARETDPLVRKHLLRALGRKAPG